MTIRVELNPGMERRLAAEALDILILHFVKLSLGEGEA